ncbi:MAG TPA: His/Gly/Thr/Pro-type tRNA ligase C-terminal domain-containing protein, partial [Candidatus Angelobacter sp.]|nr:His/Gly/Thr/Pro-type tRNA ligase C-terminal domain-containing protein [Candidatus Angelobacter sp.]
TLGTKFSDALDLKYTDEAGENKAVFMGSYGIGPSRLMGFIAGHFSDDKGLIWPENIAPFKVYLVCIGDEATTAQADKLYEELNIKGVEVLYDDRDVRPGNKFADSELMGTPYRVTVSDRTLETNQYELVERKNGQKKLLTYEQLLAKLS